jgi:maltodextrin utilization protein YvdJ
MKRIPPTNYKSINPLWFDQDRGFIFYNELQVLNVVFRIIFFMVVLVGLLLIVLSNLLNLRAKAKCLFFYNIIKKHTI